MRILVTGAAGMLGRDLLPLLKRTHDVVGVDLADFSVSDPHRCRKAVEGARPDVVVNCAAYTDVDGCETYSEQAMDVNGLAPGYLAAACRESGARLFHVSTDYVFSGEKDGPYVEDDPVGPLSAYGRTKLAGEEAIRREMPLGWTILRTAWLYGPHGRNFVDAILRLAAEKEFLTVVDDQRGSPTYTVDLSVAIASAIDAGVEGVFHAVGAGNVTWRDFAIEILKQKGIDKEVRPLTAAQLNRPAHRPANSVLSTEKLAAATGFRFRDWREALAKYLKRTGR